MNKFIVAFLLCLTSTVANAQAFQTNKPVLCDDSKKIIEALVEKYGEKLIWMANDMQDKSKFGLFVNEKTNTWTMLQFTSEVACIVGLGENSKLILGSSI